MVNGMILWFFCDLWFFLQNADVSMIINERLAAIRRLNENPTNPQAMGDLVRAQMQVCVCVVQAFTLVF